MNLKEKAILHELLLKNNDLFYKKRDNFSFTHEISHSIKTKYENPIYCKLFRYPQVHEREIESQIKDMINRYEK